MYYIILLRHLENLIWNSINSVILFSLGTNDEWIWWKKDCCFKKVGTALNLYIFFLWYSTKKIYRQTQMPQYIQ